LNIFNQIVKGKLIGTKMVLLQALLNTKNLIGHGDFDGSILFSYLSGRVIRDDTES